MVSKLSCNSPRFKLSQFLLWFSVVHSFFIRRSQIPPALAGRPSTECYALGVQQMEGGNWPASAACFAAALAALQKEPRDALTAQKQSFAAQYYAVVLLLAASSAANVPPARGAQLYRFAAALRTDERHQVRHVAVASARCVAGCLVV